MVRLIDDGAGDITLAQNPKDVKLSYQPRLEAKASGVCTALVCKPGRITLARLSRLQGQYVMLIAPGEAVAGDPAWLEECGYPMWPHAFLRLDGDLDRFVQALRSEYIHSRPIRMVQNPLWGAGKSPAAQGSFSPVPGFGGDGPADGA
jgi:hypothetical protein